MEKITAGDMRRGLISLGANTPRGIFTVDTFLAYHKKNPQIFLEFEKECFAQVQAGETLLRSKDIAERIRKNCGTKLQNSLISYYGRAFVVKHPEYKHYFQFNQCVGIKGLVE
jgi:hypothetical protein